MDTIQLTEAARDLAKDYARTGMTHIEYRQRLAALENEWREWLRQQYLPGYSKKIASAVFERAWAEGHGEGYSHVAAAYSDLADLVAIVRVEVLK